MKCTIHIIFFLSCCCFFTSSEVLQLTCQQIKAFVDGHNLRRQKVAQGAIPGHPPASNMKFMVWDEELAAKAALWAEHGIFGHNPDKNIGSQRWSLIGENVFLSTFTSNVEVSITPNIQEALDAWFDERLNYNFGPFDLVTEKPVGHYTQMIWADSSFVGCGISQTKSQGVTSTLFVCDYGPTGNFIGQIPYNPEYKGYLRCEKGTCNRPYGAYCTR